MPSRARDRNEFAPIPIPQHVVKSDPQPRLRQLNRVLNALLVILAGLSLLELFAH